MLNLRSQNKTAFVYTTRRVLKFVLVGTATSRNAKNSSSVTFGKEERSEQDLQYLTLVCGDDILYLQSVDNFFKEYW